MSRVNRQKHTRREVEDSYELPTQNEYIVRVLSSKGNNLHEVESAEDEENFLVSMPQKFRKNLWIKRNDFILVQKIDEGDKVKAEIVRVLTREHVKIFEDAKVWPKKFTKKREHAEDLDDEGLVQNTNRKFEINKSSENSDSSD